MAARPRALAASRRRLLSASQRGVALLMALILMALATIAAVAIGYNAGLFASRSNALYTQAEGLRIAQGAEALAYYGLSLPQVNSQVVSPDQPWAQPLGPVTLEEGVTAELSLEDLQGRFNINNLVRGGLPGAGAGTGPGVGGPVGTPGGASGASGASAGIVSGATPGAVPGTEDKVAGAEFEQLLTTLGLDPRWRGYVTDWLDEDTTPSTPDGAEDSTYIGLRPGYRTPNLPITSTTELLAMPGMTRAIYDKLAPFITALPPGTKINLCTASPEVLDALQGRQNYTLDPEGLAAQRKNGCHPTFSELTSSLNKATIDQLNGRTGQQTEYFRLRSWITIGTTRFTLYSVIYRQGANLPGSNQTGSTQLRTILRTFGTE